MAVPGGFFNKTSLNGIKRDKKPGFIFVGGALFPSVAVSLLDWFEKNASRNNDSTVKILLEHLYRHFPKYISNQAYLAPYERVQILIQNERTSELVAAFADVLQYIAQDEINAHPLNYSDILGEYPEDKLKISRGSIRALVNALDITIKLSVVEEGKELRKQAYYTSDSSQTFKPALLLQVQGTLYFPYISNQRDFTPREPKSPYEKEYKLEISSHTRQVVHTENKRALEKFIQNKNRLKSMLDAGDVTLSVFKDLYIKFLPSQQTVSYRLSNNKKPVDTFFSEHTEYTTNALIEVFAHGLSTEHIDPEQFFDEIERLGTKTGSYAA
jgi:hypothetical protein